MASPNSPLVAIPLFYGDLKSNHLPQMLWQKTKTLPLKTTAVQFVIIVPWDIRFILGENKVKHETQ